MYGLHQKQLVYEMSKINVSYFMICIDSWLTFSSAKGASN